MRKRKPLEWYGENDKYLGLPDCRACLEKINDDGLILACSSVGIEHGKSTGLMLRDFINDFHAKGHPA